MLPSAMTSAPKLTTASTIRSRPRVDLLARAQRLVDDDGRAPRRGWQRCGSSRGNRGSGRCRRGRCDGRRCGFFGAHGRHAGCVRVCFGQTGGEGGFHLCGAAAAHRDRHHAVLAQQGHQRGNIDASLGVAQRRQVDGHRLLVEGRAGAGEACREGSGQFREVGGLDRNRHQRQRGTLDLERGGRVRFRGNSHGQQELERPQV
jgi:hypothetical protein